MDKVRIKKLQAKLEHPILIKKKENLLYLIGRSFMHGYLLVKKNDVVFFGDGLEKAGIRHSDVLKNIGKYINPKQVLQTFADFTYGEMKYIKAKNPQLRTKVIIQSDPVTRLRAIKDAEEIAKIKKSMQIVETVFREVKHQLKSKTWTEKELAEFIKKAGLKLGAEDVSFPPIVAGGANAATPHHIPSGKRLKKGESIIIDFGFKYKGYCSDFTRTVFLKSVTGKIAAAYNQVEKTYLGCLKTATRGMSAEAVYDLSVKILAEKKLDKYFIHSLGHGTGLEIHELPNLSPHSKEVLENQMVFSIEPGVYVPKNFGIRIEDLVVIKNKAQRFIEVPTALSANIIS